MLFKIRTILWNVMHIVHTITKNSTGTDFAHMSEG